MKIYKTKHFARWAIDVELDNQYLIDAINEIAEGNCEAKLGGNIYKKRIALKNKGKRGGVRTIVAYKIEDKAFFIYGFAKSVRANITPKELIALKKLARVYLSLSSQQVVKAIKAGELVEVA